MEAERQQWNGNGVYAFTALQPETAPEGVRFGAKFMSPLTRHPMKPLVSFIRACLPASWFVGVPAGPPAGSLAWLPDALLYSVPLSIRRLLRSALPPTPAPCVLAPAIRPWHGGVYDCLQ